MHRRSGPSSILTLLILIPLAACQSDEKGQDERLATQDATEAASRDDPTEAESESMAEEAAVPESLAGSGVVGMVTLGPRCPTVEEGQECPGRAYSARLTVRDSNSGEVVTTVDSGEDGTFRLELEPGDYILEPESAQLVHEPSAKPLAFTVEPGRYTQIEMRFDSGLR